MDRGMWATWYDLPEDGKEEFLAWLHDEYLPRVLKRPGYLWACNQQNIMTPEREAQNYSRLVHVDDPGIENPGVPGGNQYLLLLGAESPHTFVDPSIPELRAQADARTLEMLSLRQNVRYCIFLEEERVNGPEYKSRHPGLTPGPVIQFGSFNINALENEDEMGTWYSRSRLPLMRPMPGCVGARKLVSIVGWAKHAIIYEFLTLEDVENHFVDTDAEFSHRVVANLVHAPHSPSLGSRIWPV